MVIGVLILCAAAMAGEGVTRVPGEPKPLGNGRIWAWVDVDEQGQSKAIGVTMTASALTNLPTGGGEACCGGHEYSLPLPSTALESTPFTHAVINWNPNGHEPAGIYDKPHFDFHFYTMSEAERKTIKESHETTSAALKAPPAECLPMNYVQAPGVVGRMGSHWVDTTAPEFNGKPFTHTFIYGSYNGRITFVEPMITKAVLETKLQIAAPIPQPATPIDPRFAPDQYRIQHDAQTGDITVSMIARK